MTAQVITHIGGAFAATVFDATVFDIGNPQFSGGTAKGSETRTVSSPRKNRTAGGAKWL